MIQPFLEGFTTLTDSCSVCLTTHAITLLQPRSLTSVLARAMAKRIPYKLRLSLPATLLYCTVQGSAEVQPDLWLGVGPMCV